MSQATTTATDSAHPVDLTALHLQLNEDGQFYRGNQNSKEARERLLHTLQTNDCRKIITAVVDGDNFAPLFVRAGYRGHVDILEAFLNNGMNIDIKDDEGWTALAGASYCNHEECVRFLLDHSASVDLQDNSGCNALMITSEYGKIKIVEILLAKNANLDFQNIIGMTALMLASSYGRKEIVQLLLNHNPDIELKNNDGRTALDLAKDKEVNEMLRNHVSTTFVLK